MWRGGPRDHRHQADSRGGGRRHALQPADVGAGSADRSRRAGTPTSPTRTTSRTRPGPSTGPARPPWGTARPSPATPKTDDLIDRGRSEIDPAKRRAIYRELELYFRDSGVDDHAGPAERRAQRMERAGGVSEGLRVQSDDPSAVLQHVQGEVGRRTFPETRENSAGRPRPRGSGALSADAVARVAAPADGPAPAGSQTRRSMASAGPDHAIG